MPRCGAGRPCKRVLESLATESSERSTGIESVSQGQTPHGTVGASGSRIPTVLSPELPTPTVSTVALVVPSAIYSAPPLAVPATTYPAPSPPPPVPATAYPAPPPPVLAAAYLALAAPVTPVPTAYSTRALAVPVAPYLVPSPTVPPAAPAYIDPAVPPAIPAPAYAAASGGLDGHIQVKIAGFGNSSYTEALDRALMIEAAQQKVNADKKRKQTDRTSGQTQQPQATGQQQNGHSQSG
ncbi:proline-rich protein 36-like [Zingiber officinale]|uniref:proline-rich protein 36-like n=1 Tax=Zingiber officinale TaxID=94328 RepID=UPI001C4BAE41|nr:proline-rich protein 36-like [Zingiber officinale]